MVWNSPQLSPDVTLLVVLLQYFCLYNGTLTSEVSTTTGQFLALSRAYRRGCITPSTYTQTILHFTCLQTSDLFPRRFVFEDNEVFRAAVGPLDPGTVCLFGGFYFFQNPVNVAPIVPHETCGIPASPSTG